MYDRLAKLSGQLPMHSGRVLSISHSANLAELMQVKPTEVVSANYPEHNMVALSFPDESFDFVFSDQVLEHVAGDPFQAISECRRVLRSGGVAVHTTCFVNPVHGVPQDFWRFTPDALALLHENWSRIIEVSGWGNFDVWDIAVRDGLRFVPVPHATWHPLHSMAIRNDPLWPIVTWIVAVK